MVNGKWCQAGVLIARVAASDYQVAITTSIYHSPFTIYPIGMAL